MPRQPYLYQHYNWPELGEAAKKQPVIVLAIDSMEDHGCTCRGVDYVGIPVSRLHEGPQYHRIGSNAESTTSAIM